MSSFEAREHLSAYLDGQLSGDDLSRMEASLAEDAGLRSELDELQALVADLDSLPEVEAPAGLVASVLAQVSDLPIPSELEPTESSDLSQQSSPLLDVSAAEAPHEAAVSNVVRLSWWIKGPAVSALAAVLVLGVTWVLNPPVSGPPDASLAAFSTSPAAERLAAPAPSGVLDSEDVDGLVELNIAAGAGPADAAEDELEAASEPLMAEPTPRVSVGMTGGGSPSSPRPPSRASARRSERSVPSSAVGPDGVYEAEWEEADAAPVVASAHSSGAEAGALAGESSQRARARLAAAESDATSELTLAGEPLEDFVDPPGDEEFVASRGAARRGEASSPVPLGEVSFGARSTQPSTLTVASKDAAQALLATLRGKGWTVESSQEEGSSKSLAVTVRAPSAQGPELLGTLHDAGALQMSGAASVSGDTVSVQLLLRW